jgi:hypothetical protein
LKHSWAAQLAGWQGHRSTGEGLVESLKDILIVLAEAD